MKKQQGSLLPYLQGPEGEGRLKLSVALGTGGERSYPFRLLDSSAPYFNVLEGTLATDGGSELKRVLLLVEKDRYLIGNDLLRRVVNPEIERAWQEARVRSGAGPGAILLASQSDAEGKALRQASLFYCREQRLFFHPVCPSCGLQLTLCSDDAFLSCGGLATYAGSTKRYLYCRACCALGEKELYLFEREPCDAASLRDRWSLIERLGGVDRSMDPQGALPCVGCPEHGACFGPQGAARSRMIPFSFYPFHLLVCEAPTLHAAEFLALAAGAEAPELERLLDPVTEEGRLCRLREFAGSARASHFGAADPRRFTELLFLKLSFLDQVLRQVLPQPGAGRCGLERVWVRLAAQGQHLPSLWNFSVQLLEAVAPRGARRSAAEEYGQLGLFWFQALVQNRVLTGSDLLHAVADHLAQEGALVRFLAPQNLFWDPERATVWPEALPLWERACALGLEFLQAAAGAALDAPGFLERLAALVDEARGALSTGGEPCPHAEEASASASPGASRLASENDLLQRVVARLIERYRNETQQGAQEGQMRQVAQVAQVGQVGQVSDDVADLDGSEAATLILRPPTDGAQPQPAREPESLTETVLIAPGAPAPASCGNRPAMEPDIEETVLLRRPQGEAPRPLPESHEDEPVLETVILAPTRGAVQGAAPSEAVCAGKLDEELAETVVIKPQQRPRVFPR
jgi:hypothetical protein